MATYSPNSGPMGFSIPAPQYAAAGDYTIKVWVEDPAGDSTPVVTLPTVTYTPTPPSNLNLTLANNVVQTGDEVDLSGTFTDPRSLVGDTVTIDWGDDTTAPDVTTMTLDPGDQFFQADPQYYATAGVYTIAVTLTSDAGSATASTSITVNPVLPDVAVDATVPTTAEQGANPGEFTISREDDGGATGLIVNYTLTDVDVNGTVSQAVTGQATIPAGQTETTIDVNPLDTGLVGGDKTVTLTLQPATGDSYVVDTDYAAATVTIHQNDLPTVSLVAVDPGTPLSEAGDGSGSFVVSLDQPASSTLLVPYDIGGTATNGDDYQMISGDVVIPAGNTSATIPITARDQGIVGGSKTVTLTLTASADGDYNVNPSNSATLDDRGRRCAGCQHLSAGPVRIARRRHVGRFHRHNNYPRRSARLVRSGDQRQLHRGRDGYHGHGDHPRRPVERHD